MGLEDFSTLNLKNFPEVFRKHWNASQASYPGKDIWFLKKGFIDEANNVLRLPEYMIEAFYNALDTVNSHEELCRLAWHCHYVLFTLVGEQQNIISGWDSLNNLLGEFSGMFTALIIVSALPNVKRFYKEHGIHDQVLLDTFSDIEIWMRRHYKKTGVLGLSEWNWLINHITCKIFRLGRLQYIHKTLDGKILVFRNRHNSKVAAFTEPGIKFRSDGQVDGTNDIFDEENAWTSQIDNTDGVISGNPILPSGRALKERASLAASEWDLVLSAGDPVLAMHIPEGGKLSFESCGESLHMASEFFPEYFPQTPYRAFFLCTWFLDAQLQDLLPSDSNIVKFQREFFLYPVLANDVPTYERVFGSSSIDPQRAPRDTLLRRAILDFVIAGNHMRYNAGFILKDDLGNWGKAYYQSVKVL